MRLLDLFSGAGGAAMGYHEAGFDEIVGVDIVPQPRYPFTFVQGDALEYVRLHGHEFDVIHSSPPCQGYNSLHKVNGRLHGKTYPDLIAATRKALQATGKPYVIENVVDAKRHLINPVMLCGTFFGLKVYRHRLFECNPSLSHLQPKHVPHGDRSPGCNGNRTSPKGYITVCGGKGGGFRIEPASKAMGIDWMIRRELAQAIPPAYTRWIGRHLLEAMESLQPTESDVGKEIYVDQVEKRGVFLGGIHQRIVAGTTVALAVVQFPGCASKSVFPLEELELIPEEKTTAQAVAKHTKSTGEYTMSMQVAEEVLVVLRSATIEGNLVKLNSPQLDRKLYAKVNEVLERIGGKWKGGKVAAHVFDADPTEALRSILDGQSLPDKNPFAFFATPDGLALRMAKALLPENVADGVLEPSAGNGALALAVQSLYRDVQVDCVEIDSSRAKTLKLLNFNVYEGDFLSYEPGRKYRAVIMNPPFSTKEDKQAYVTHIEKAFSHLEDGGQLIAIAPSALAFNSQRRVQELRALIQEQGTWEHLDSKSFKVSGTNVETVLLSLQKPKKELSVINPQSALGELINLHSTEVEVVATSDLDELTQLEGEIEKIKESAWVEIGCRLKRIKEASLWKTNGYTNWDKYCKERWNLAKSTANEMIAGVGVLDKVDAGAASLSRNATKPIARMLNQGVPVEQVQELVQGLVQSGKEIDRTEVEEAAIERGLLPKKEPKPMVAQAQSVGLSGKESQQLPDSEPNADIAVIELPRQLIECNSAMEIREYCQRHTKGAIAQLKDLTWEQRFELRDMCKDFEHLLMGAAIEEGVTADGILNLLDRDKDCKLEWQAGEIVRLMRENDELRQQLTTVKIKPEPTRTDEWYTPPEYIEMARRVMGTIDLDPASNELAQSWIKATKYFTEDDDGLVTSDWYEWNNRNPITLWCNPPYGRMVEEWLWTAINGYQEGRVKSAILLLNRTGAAWYKKRIKEVTAICEVHKRIAFLDENGNRQDSPRYYNDFLYLGEDVDRFVEVFSVIGDVRVMQQSERMAA